MSTTDREKKKDKDKDKTKDKIKKKDADGSRVLSRKGSKSKIEEAASILPDDIASPTMAEQPKEKGCIHHQLKLTSFCESCEEPICEQCAVYGPHNNQLHRINNLGEAYKSRVMAMHHVISGSLVNKRDQLIAQLHRIDHRLEEIKHVKTVIERDVRAEFGGILERLRSAEGVKLAVLQHEIAGLQRDVDKINDIVNVVNELTTEKADPIDFLLRCRHLTDTIEFTVAKPFKTQIEVAPYDLPRELGDQREKIEKMNVIKDILEMKDKVIFDLIKKYNDEEKRIIAEMNKTAQEEISEWSKLTDRFSGELKKYHLVCYYCGRGMDEKSVNRSCDTNNRTQIPAGFGFTVEAPERTWHGTRRHFFGKPKPELVKGGTIVDINFPEFDFSGKNSKDEKSFKNQYYMFLEVLLAKVRKYCYEKNIQVDKLFTEHDKENKGFMNHVVFTFLLHQYCGVDQIEINKLQTILDPEKKDQIPYGELLKMIHDPKYLIQFQEAGQAKK